tara:strand:+ start:4302 stop:5483 length:1182 start_codon:yes stop_codon:yes gene_type:complete
MSCTLDISGLKNGNSLVIDKTKVYSTTEDVASAVSVKAPIVSPVFTGTPQAPTKAATNNSTALATTKFVTNAVSDKIRFSEIQVHTSSNYWKIYSETKTYSGTAARTLTFVNSTSSGFTYQDRIYLAVPGATIPGGNFANSNEGVFFFTTWASFTGEHLCVVLQKHYDNKFAGLIYRISSKKQYINLNGSSMPKIDESLPVLELCTTEKDKRVIGVFNNTDIDKGPHEKIKLMKYDKNSYNFSCKTRAVINSLGEGAIWVCNKEGIIECGDLITSSVVPGYGVLQDDDIIHNYTVCKITCDCDFSIVEEKQQKLLCSTDELNNKEVLFSENGDIQYEDDNDASGNVIFKHKYETRFIMADGTILTDKNEYQKKVNEGAEVYIACLVGCIYHCG